MPRTGRRAVSLTVYATAEESALLDVVRAARAIHGSAESRTTLLMGLVRKEADRLRKDRATPGYALDALAVAVRAVAERAAPPRTGRRPVIADLRPAGGV